LETARAAGSATSPNSFRRCYGIQFTKREGTEAYWVIPFDRLCDALGIEHRLTKINHPWTNGQVERMNRTIRTIKEATVRRNYYQSHDQSHDHLKQHLHTFLMAYTFAKRRKTLKGLTPYEHICKIWTNEPERFTVNPFQHNVGLNT
jgi:transposase InsO family protein